MSKKLMASVLIASYCLNSLPVVAGRSEVQARDSSDEKCWKQNRSLPQQVWRGVQLLVGSPILAGTALLMLSSRLSQAAGAPTDVSRGNNITALGNAELPFVNGTLPFFATSTDYQDSTVTTTSDDLTYRGYAPTTTSEPTHNKQPISFTDQLKAGFNSISAAYSLFRFIPNIKCHESGICSAYYGPYYTSQDVFQKIQKKTTHFFAASANPSATQAICWAHVGSSDSYELCDQKPQTGLLTSAQQATSNTFLNFFNNQEHQIFTSTSNAQYAYIDLQSKIELNEATRMFEVTVVGKSRTDKEEYDASVSRIAGLRFLVVYASNVTTITMSNGTHFALLNALSGDQLSRTVEFHTCLMETLAGSNDPSQIYLPLNFNSISGNVPAASKFTLSSLVEINTDATQDSLPPPRMTIDAGDLIALRVGGVGDTKEESLSNTSDGQTTLPTKTTVSSELEDLNMSTKTEPVKGLSSAMIATIIKGAGIATLIGVAAIYAWYKKPAGKEEKTAAVELQPLSAAI